MDTADPTTAGPAATDLAVTARQQIDKAVQASSGRASVTAYGGSGHSLRQTVVALAAGRSLADHENPGEATLQVLLGRVRLTSPSSTQEGGPGELLVIPQERHGLEALEDAAVLLTVAKTG